MHAKMNSRHAQIESESQGHGPGPGADDASSATGRRILCPYCGHLDTDPEQCPSCAGLFEPLSKQATQNAMGAWFIRDEQQPFRPGCSHQTLRKLVARGKITRGTILRGPTTRQFWSFASDVPGVANLLGECHNCHAKAGPDDYMCNSCGAVFVAPSDRQNLGLGPVRLLPGQAPPDVVAASSMRSGETRESAARPAPSPAPTAPRDAPLSQPGVPAPAKIAPRSTAVAPAPPGTTRRLRRQVANYRAGVFLLALTTLAALGVAGYVILKGAGAPSASNSPSETPAAPTQQAGSPVGDAAGDPARPGAADAQPPDARTNAQAAGEESQASPDPITQAAARLQEKRDEAMTLAESGEIEDIEEAIRRLERLREAAPEGAAPETLPADLKRLRDRRDELVLEMYLD